MMRIRSWIVVLSAIVSGISIAVVQNKVLPCIDVLQMEFMIDRAMAGWLSSVFSVMGIVIAFPAALAVEKFGTRKICLFSLISTMVGSLIGLCADSAIVLMLSRIVEGIGAGLISIAVPILISMWFPVEKRGLPTGVWSSWQFLGQTISFLLGSHLLKQFHWKVVWVASVIITAIGILFCFVFVKEPPLKEIYYSAEKREKVSVFEVLKGKNVWLISLSMFFFCFACFGFVTWVASCWHYSLDIELHLANQYISLFGIISLPAVVLVGIILDHVDHRRFGIISTIGYTVIAVLGMMLPGVKWLMPFVIIYPFLDGAVATSLWTLIPQSVAHIGHAPTAISFFNLMSNLGMLVGPPAVGALAENGEWAICAVAIAISGIIAMMLLWKVKIKG